MAGRKYSSKDLSLLAASAKPLHNFPSSQNVNPGNDVSLRCDSLYREDPSSISEMGPAHPALETPGSRVYLSSRTTPLSKNGSTSYLNENDSPAFATQWLHGLDPLTYEYLNGQSLFGRPHTQNDATTYLSALPADPAHGNWNAIGYNPFRTDDVLLGIPAGQFCERDYHLHPAMQESDGSGISSLSSSYIYKCPESQPFTIDHDPPSHVPWIRPNTIEENLSGNFLWTQDLGLSTQPMIDAFSERPVSDERLITTPAHIVHASLPDIAVNGHQIVWNSSDGQEVKLPQTPRRRSTQQREEANKIRKKGACRKCRRGRRKCHPSHRDPPVLSSPDSSSPWSLVSEGSSSFASVDFPTPSPVNEDQPP